MIDPYNWSGFVTLENMEEIAVALRMRLSGRFDRVYWIMYEKEICLIDDKDAIQTWRHERRPDGGILVHINHGLHTIDGYNKEALGTEYLKADTSYFRFGKHHVFVQDKDDPKYRVFIPREEKP